jgi:tryptophanyl-tRNA synthetase
MKTFLTGIKPTGPAHLGNYLGAMRPALCLSKSQQLFCSVADYHAFTTPQDPARLREHTYDLAAAWLAAGLDPVVAILFRQSSIGGVRIDVVVGCHHRVSPANSSSNAESSAPRPASRSAPRCTRSKRRLRSARTWRSPRACAALTTPNDAA